MKIISYNLLVINLVNDEIVNFGNHEFKVIDRNIVTLSGIKKIISFNDLEFFLESVMGIIHIKGEKLEIIRMDTTDGNIKIKGKINSLEYMDSKRQNKEESILAKLFK